MITSLRGAFGKMELVDPALPQAAVLAPQLEERVTSIAADPWTSLVNFLVTVLIAALFYLLVAEPRIRFRQHTVGEGERR
jgi:peptidoglycan/LPS O-acetylase OafA/YrhL